MTVRHAARNASGQASQRPGATFGAELRDAVSIRTMVMVIGVLALQLGFILSYIGAFHAPQPQRIPVAVVAPSEVAAQAAARINSIPGQPLRI